MLRIALAQVDLTVGDIPGNAALVREWTKRAAEAGAQLVVFPEMTLTGYPPEDLVHRDSFVRANLDELAVLAGQSPDGPVVVVGYCDDDGGLRNAAAVLRGGAVVARYFKHHLPNYGVFDERRYFTPGDQPTVVEVAGVRVGVTICEDLWQPGPVTDSAAAGAELVLVLNGSPYERGKRDVRRELVARRAAESGAVLAYVNTVGGQDELVFDGDSTVVTPDGTVLARAPRFEEHLLLWDWSGGPDRAVGEVAEELDECAEVWGALVSGTRDYVLKNGFASVVLGLSGGIDSALVATIAADALGPEAVWTVAMPSAYSSEHSLEDAAELAARQGLRHRVVPIEPMVAAYQAALAEAGGLHGVAAENLQARVRGTLLMALSNEHGHLVLTTGNKSELATGFSTLYGDSAGGFAVIKDVPKTTVWALARWRNAQAVADGAVAPIPERSITKPPSAELAPGQLDEDRLPPYDVLDAVLEAYVEDELGRDAIVARGFEPAVVDRVIRLVDLAEYKRRQYPPGPKITERAFGRDRRLPITNRFTDS